MRPPYLPLARLVVWAGLACAALGSVGAASVAEVQQRLAQGDHLTLIDLRLPALYARGHLPGAINVPASVCAERRLPPLGKVIVYGGGLGREDVAAAAATLAAKPGITVETLEGGYSSWESAHAATSATKGVKPETFNYITYAELKRAQAAEMHLVDLRRPQVAVARARSLTADAASAPAPLTDLGVEFPAVRLSRAVPARPLSTPTGAPAMTVLIDNGDDSTAHDAARLLKAGGNHRYAILLGGELTLAREGRSGTQRVGTQVRNPSTAGVAPPR